ncbi:MAG: MBL fold metallo-hydrolase [Candidatus Odinarchaeia archaeon]
MKITENIYYIPGLMYDSNCYIISDEELTLIDCGTGYNFKYFIERIKKEGLEPSNIKKVILTHVHFDHSGGLKEIIKFCKPEINVFHLEAPFIEKADSQMLLLDMFNAHFEPIKVDSRLIDGQIIKCGDKDFQIIHTPGHTLGSICLYNEEDEVLISGDTVFSKGSFGRVDYPSGSMSDLINSIEKLLNLKVKYLLPGHEMISNTGSKDINQVYQMLKTYY